MREGSSGRAGLDSGFLYIPAYLGLCYSVKDQKGLPFWDAGYDGEIGWEMSYLEEGKFGLGSLSDRRGGVCVL